MLLPETSRQVVLSTGSGPNVLAYLFKTVEAPIPEVTAFPVAIGVAAPDGCRDTIYQTCRCACRPKHPQAADPACRTGIGVTS